MRPCRGTSLQSCRTFCRCRSSRASRRTDIPWTMYVLIAHTAHVHICTFEAWPCTRWCSWRVRPARPVFGTFSSAEAQHGLWGKGVCIAHLPHVKPGVKGKPPPITLSAPDRRDDERFSKRSHFLVRRSASVRGNVKLASLHGINCAAA